MPIIAQRRVLGRFSFTRSCWAHPRSRNCGLRHRFRSFPSRSVPFCSVPFSFPVFGKGPPQQGDVTGYLGDLGFDNTNVYKI